MRIDPFAWIVRGMLWMAGVGVLTLLLAVGAVARWDTALYDAHQRYWHYTPDNSVVIVAIDPKSLSALGRWPWSRQLHAQLVDRLTAAGVRAIGMDVSMSTPEAQQPDNDRLLAQAMERSGKVVMPVFAEAVDLGGQLEEILPLPAFMHAAAGIGHVDVARDPDGLARGAYLTSGLGGPYWPSLALALFRLDGRMDGQPDGRIDRRREHRSAQQPGRLRDVGILPGLRNPAAGEASPYLWIRDHHVLLRYAGPAGSFGRVSYVDVIEGRVPDELLTGKQVLVGATAEGMGDILQTPESPMPGVEYQANILESLQRGLLVTPLGFAGRFLMGAGLLLLPLALQGMPGLRRPWRAVLLAGLLATGWSVFLLRAFQLWWPPTACLLVIGTGLVAWQLFQRWTARSAGSGQIGSG